MTELLRICVTGPECSGKTTMAERLARVLGTEWVPEAARLYAERTPRALTDADVSPIAREHIALADAAAARAGSAGTDLIVLDTDLVSTLVYSRHYYGDAPAWIEPEARARLADLYLLCDVDIPWVADGIRDQPDNRGGMFERFRAELERLGACIVVIRGAGDERCVIADGAVGARIRR